MQEISDRKQNVLDVLDDEIAELEKVLAKYQPQFDELAQLKKTRATLLSERSVTGAVRQGTKITMEQVIHGMREMGGSASAPDLAEHLGIDHTIVRSHLNRYRDERYRRNGEGMWYLIGEGEQADDEEEGDE